MAAGSSKLTVASAIDFQVGQGILVAGAGTPAREVLTLVIDEEAIADGAVAVSLPDEVVQTVPVTATKETLKLTVTTACEQTGEIAMVLDSVQFLIPVSAGESPAQIADRIRAWYLEDWTAGGTGGTAVVDLQAAEPGKKRDSCFFGQGTGVAAKIAANKGTRTSAREVVAALKRRTYSTWRTGGYSNSNVLFFIASGDGPRNGHRASVHFSSTGMSGRIEPIQYGSYLVSRVAAIAGNVITLSQAAASAVSNVFVEHDDSASLQAALNAAAGKTLNLPAGTYRLARGLTVPGATSVRGEGSGATVLQYQAVGLTGISVPDGADDVYIGHLKIKNVCYPDAIKGSDSEVHGVAIASAERTVIECCGFDNCDDAAIRVGYGSGGNSSGTRLLYNTVFNTAEGSGIEVIRGEDCLILGNIVRRSAQHGVRLCGARRPIATGNLLDGNTDGFSIQGYGDGRNVTQRTQDFVIQGNVVQNDAVCSIGIFNQANSGIIRGNLLEGKSAPTGVNVSTHLIGAGRRKSSCFDITIEGNIIKGFNRSIQVRGDWDGIVIRGNTIKGYEVSGEGIAYAVFLDSQDIGCLGQIVIEGNTIICTALDQFGLGLFRPSPRSRVHVHNNTFMLRLSNPDPANVARCSVQNGATAGSNSESLISVKTGSCTVTLPGGATASGTTTCDTNVYESIPV